MDELKYPIGKFTAPDEYTPKLIQQYIQLIAKFPLKLKAETAHLKPEQLDTPYRPEGWTLRQVVHHCADSHLNSFIRFKLTITENKPIIKPYLEAAWAQLDDSKNYPIEPSLQLLEALHARWVAVLNALSVDDLERSYIHPESKREIQIKEALGIYAWHGEHHLAHITQLKKQNNWK